MKALACLDPEAEIVVDSGISMGAASWANTDGDVSPCESLVPFPATQRLHREDREKKGGSLG